jgi:hypothetical protein
MRALLVLATPQQTRPCRTPATPLQGSLLRVTVPAGAHTAAPAGSLAGEPLHFGGTRGRVGASAVPLSATDSVVLWVRRPGADSVGLPVPVALRPTGVERLTTDTTFTAPLDSALARRVRDETARVVARLQGSHQRPRLWTELPPALADTRHQPVRQGPQLQRG